MREQQALLVREAIPQNLNLLIQVIEQSADPSIIVHVASHNILHFNNAAASLFEISPCEAINRSLQQFLAVELRSLNGCSSVPPEKERRTGQGHRLLAGTKANGESCPLYASLVPFKYANKNAYLITLHRALQLNKTGHLVPSQSYACAVPELSSIEPAPHHIHHDMLTGLTNRTLFFDRLQQACLRTERHGMLALLYLNIDELKIISEALGHDLGDKLLTRFANRLSTCVRKEDTVARFSGDEFTILLENISDEHQANKVAAYISKKSQAPFEINDRTFFVSINIGIAIAKNNQNSPHDLIKQANIAMRKAKETGHRAYHHYTPALNKAALQRMNLGSDLHLATKRQEFHIHYQPQIHSQTGHISGAEALLRWKHPSKGLIPPSKFVPMLEANGLITHVGNWLIDKVIAQKSKWSETYPASTQNSVSINVSTIQLSRGDIVRTLSEALKKYGVSPEEITLEMTESVILKDSDQIKRLLTRLRNLGVCIALDDFGTGYSSLSYLKKFPISQIKIDQSFIKNILHKPDDNAIATAMIQLGHSLKLDVVAEGVDCLEKVKYLMDCGCDLLQGFYFSKAVPASRIDWASNQLTAAKKHPILYN